MSERLSRNEIQRIQEWYENQYPNADEKDKRGLAETLAEIDSVYFEFIDNVILTSDADKQSMESVYPAGKNPAKCSYYFREDLVEVMTDQHVDNMLGIGKNGFIQLIATLADQKPQLENEDRAANYHRAFSVKSEMVETTWNDRFAKWYAEYTGGGKNAEYHAHIKEIAANIPDEYREFIESTMMGVDGKSRDFKDYLNVRNLNTFGTMFNKAIADRDPKGMEMVLLDILNNNATVKDPQAAMAYCASYKFEQEFLENAIDPTAERLAAERQAQSDLDKYNNVRNRVDYCKRLQEAIIADMDAKRPVEREKKLSELAERRIEDHRRIDSELRHTYGLKKVFKRLSMRWEAHQQRKEELALYDEHQDTLRKIETTTLDELTNMQKQLNKPDGSALITDEFLEKLNFRHETLQSYADRLDVSVDPPATEVGRAGAPNQRGRSMEDRLNPQLGTVTKQGVGTRTKQPDEVTRSGREEIAFDN